MTVNLVMLRLKCKSDYVIGNLSWYDNGGFICNTLEPVNCIPEGTYALNISVSPKFERYLIHVCNVPNRDGILIHTGNTAKDTSGCILVGYNTSPGVLTQSTECEKEVFEIVRMCNQGYLKVLGEPA